MRRRLACARRRAARGLAAARGRGVHGAGQQRARDRRPRDADGRRAGGGARVRRTSTGSRRGCRRRWARRGTRRSPRRGGCSTSATRRAPSCRCRWRTSPDWPSARRRTVAAATVGGAAGSPVPPTGRRPTGRASDSPAAAGLTVEVGAPTDAWWRLVLGGPPTPAQRHVLAGSCAERARHSRPRTGVVGAGRVVVRGGPPAPVGAHRRPRRPAPRARHRAAGRGRALGTRARRPLGRAAGGGAQHRGARALRPAGVDRAPPLPLPGAARGSADPAYPAQRPQPRPHPADDEQQRLPRRREAARRRRARTARAPRS